MADAVPVGLVSLGCGKNQVDSEVMMGLLDRAGFVLTSHPEQAEVLIVNTCGFVAPAQEEAVVTILEMAQFKRLGRCRVLIAAGCLAQRHGEELLEEIPELDAVLGTGRVHQIQEAITRARRGDRPLLVAEPGGSRPGAMPRFLSSDAPWAYLKLSEGCDNHCAYCVIPSLRGPRSSRSLEELEEEARALTELGVLELVLIAQDTAAYGEDLYGEPRLLDLLERLERLPAAPWLRVLYCHPGRMHEPLIRAFRDFRQVVPYFDLPFQHVNDKILRDMGRGYDGQRVRGLVEEIRDAVPQAVIRSTFLVGFPGETEVEFQELLQFLRDYPLERAGVFAYSREEGTRAAQFPQQVSEEEAGRRRDLVSRVQGEMAWELERQQVGRVLEVLVEGYEEETGYWRGRSYRESPEVDPPVFFRGPDRLFRTRVPVRLDDVDERGVWGGCVR